MKRTFFALLCAAALISAPALAQETSEGTSKDALSFVSDAAVANMFEIESSKVAAARAKDPQVRAFAQQMIADHTQAGDKMKATIAPLNIAAPTALDEKHQKMLNDLKEAKAEDFDGDYVDAQVKAHKEAVSLFEKYSEKGDNEALRRFASDTLPTLRAHDEHINQIDDSEKKTD